jgi:hypothetical protein
VVTYGGSAYGAVPYAGPAIAGGGSQVTINGGLYPQVVIEIAPGYKPFQASPVWVDITADVGDWECHRGRQHELNRFEAGQLKVSIDNRGGPYYPFNTAAPPTGYSGNITPGMPIRIRAVYGSAVWPVYYGFTESIKPKWRSINEGEVELQARDVLKYLNLKRVTSISNYTATITADAPSRWYRLDEAPGSTTAADSSGNGVTALVTAKPTVNAYDTPAAFGSATAVVASGGTAFDCGTNLGLVSWGSQDQSFTANFSVEAWVNVRLPGTLFEGTNAGGSFFFLGINDGTAASTIRGTVQVYFYNSINFTTMNGYVPVNDGKWHHVVATYNGAGNVVLYIDGVADNTLAVANPLGVKSFSCAFGGIPNVFGSGGTPSFNGVIDECAVWLTTTLTATQVATHFVAGALPRLQEISGARISAILATLGVTGSALDTGNSVLQAATNTIVTASALANIQAVADTEGGHLFVNGAGQVVFYDRYHTSKTPNSTAALILGDAPLGNAPSLRLPGTSGNYASTPDSAAISLQGTTTALRSTAIQNSFAATPDSAALSVTGDMDVRVKLGHDNWRPNERIFFAAKWLDAVQRSWVFYMDTSGGIGNYFSTTGANFISTNSNAVVAFTPGQVGWVRFTRASGSGDVVYYTSTDGTTWTQLGSTQTGTAGTIFDSTTAVTIGAYNPPGGTATTTAGAFFYNFEYRNGIAGTVVANPDFTATPWAIGDTTNTARADATGNTWTLNGYVEIVATAERRSLRLGSAYAQVPDSVALSITGDLDVRIKLAMDDWTSDRDIINKWGAAGQRSWGLYMQTSGIPVFAFSVDGTAIQFRAATAAPTVTDGFTLWLRVTLTVNNGDDGWDHQHLRQHGHRDRGWGCPRRSQHGRERLLRRDPQRHCGDGRRQSRLLVPAVDGGQYRRGNWIR